MGYEVLHDIVDCLWVMGEPISVFKEAGDKETGILTEVDTYWITFLHMSDGTGAYNHHFVRPNTGKMKIRVVAARKDDTRSTSTKCNRRSSRFWVGPGACKS